VTHEPDTEFSQLPEDMDEVREALEISKIILETSPVVVFRRTPSDNYRLVYVSENIGRFGWSAEQFMSGVKNFSDIVHPDDKERLREEIEGHHERGASEYTQEYRTVTIFGRVRWIEDTTGTVRDEKGEVVYYQGIVVDVTERKLAQLKALEQEKLYRRIVETAGEGYMRMNMNLEYVDVNDAYCRMLGYSREEIIDKHPYDFATDDYKNFLIANKERLLAQDYRRFEGTMVHKDGRHVPVLVNSNSLFCESGEPIGHVAFVTDLTEQKKSLALAAEVQRSLLPSQAPEVGGLDVAGKSIPCDEVGGDYFDFMVFKENGRSKLSTAVGDISGHGVDSALLMTSARASLRNLMHADAPLPDVINSLNQSLAADFMKTSRFMTMFVLEIDLGDDMSKPTMNWVRAGHDPALIFDPKTDSFTELAGGSIPLGIVEDFSYSQDSCDRLNPGAVIAIGTDGIWEARNLNEEMYGKKRFQDALRSYAELPAVEIVNNVINDVFLFGGGNKPQDDVTLVVVKVTG
jgi:sigma-B regulation protein RsbU (phosphoserine phosphatase)